MEHIKNTLEEKNQFDEYIGLRPAGNFFAYEREFVWIYLANNNNESSAEKYKSRHFSHGFYVTITTIDDHALYADWDEPISNEQLKSILYYFDALCIDGLDTAQRTLADIESMIGECSSVSYS